MHLRRIFATSIALGVAYVLVALVLAWVGLGDARAQASCDPGPGGNCTREQALALCNEQRFGYSSDPGATVCATTATHYIARTFPGGSWLTGAPHYRYQFFWVTECPDGYFWDNTTNSCGQPCSDEAPIGNESAHAPGDAQGFCQNGCAYSCSGVSLLLTIDGQLRTVCGGRWETSGGATCSAGDPDPLTPVVDTDGDGVSDDNDRSPNNPGESGDGSGQDVSIACGGPGQPECAPDGSNEGSGKGNTSGGGGDCNTPPRSSGDAILAQIAFQTWATRCAISGTANAGSGSGSGTGTGEGDGDGDGDQPGWTKGDGPPAPSDERDYVSEQTRWGLPVSTDLLDQENIFGNASCENFSITFWRGMVVSTADVEGWCMLQQVLRGLITIFGAFTAVQILMGKW